MADAKAYLFGTCLIDMFYPEAGMDAIALLKLCGYQTVFPQQQTCCGQPPYNSGYSNPTVAIAKQTIDLFSHNDYPLVVPSASCAGMIKHQYPSLFPTDSVYREKAKRLADRTYELIDFILEKLPYEKARQTPAIRVALHESCASQREMNVSNQWRTILEKLPNVEMRIPKRHHECCGFGGTFAVKSDKLSAVMTEDKCQALLDTQAEEITSGDCGCLMNLQGHLEHNGHPTTCKPLARFVAERFGVHHAH